MAKTPQKPNQTLMTKSAKIAGALTLGWVGLMGMAGMLAMAAMPSS